ncbi:MAG: hypothetical protein AAF416_17205 [Pseudomonadota bacterium]
MTERPKKGGQYTRDQKTGKLKRVAQTAPAQPVTPPKPATPKPAANEEA